MEPDNQPIIYITAEGEYHPFEDRHNALIYLSFRKFIPIIKNYIDSLQEVEIIYDVEDGHNILRDIGGLLGGTGSRVLIAPIIELSYGYIGLPIHIATTMKQRKEKPRRVLASPEINPLVTIMEDNCTLIEDRDRDLTKRHSLFDEMGNLLSDDYLDPSEICNEDGDILNKGNHIFHRVFGKDFIGGGFGQIKGDYNLSDLFEEVYLSMSKNEQLRIAYNPKVINDISWIELEGIGSMDEKGFHYDKGTMHKYINPLKISYGRFDESDRMCGPMSRIKPDF